MINIWAILLCMILSVVLGFFWYGPLFGKKWMELSGIKMPEQKTGMATVMTKPILLSLIGAFLVVYMLSYSIAFHNGFYQTSGYMTGVSMAFMLWLGFIVPVFLNFLGWEGKPKALFFINSGYWLAFFLISSMIVTAFM